MSDVLSGIRSSLRGMSAEQIGSEFGAYMRRAFETCITGALPRDNFCPRGVLYQAALEGYAQYMRDRDLRIRINQVHTGERNA